MIKAFGRALFITIILFGLMIAFERFIHPISDTWRYILYSVLGIIFVWLGIMFFLDPPEDWQ